MPTKQFFILAVPRDRQGNYNPLSGSWDIGGDEPYEAADEQEAFAVFKKVSGFLNLHSWDDEEEAWFLGDEDTDEDAREYFRLEAHEDDED